MASGWVKSLQCKSRAFDDVYHPSAKNLIPSSSCRRSSQSIKDVIEATTKKQQHKNPRNVKQATKPEPGLSPTVRARHSERTTPRNSDHAIYPALTELPEGHPSRNVVEIIFHTRWGPKPFSGRIEMIFKVQHASRTAARFEEYREMVKCRATSGPSSGRSSEENARCVADGNEVMRFYCLGPPLPVERAAEGTARGGFLAGKDPLSARLPAAAGPMRAPAAAGEGGQCWFVGSLRVGFLNKSGMTRLVGRTASCLCLIHAPCCLVFSLSTNCNITNEKF
ncbi:hypothetical protein CISIN_1g023656mg [Citrus sinensis]|uniref:Uncharacterized protein n=1 Tax=Citrus sinensis TaxID=2711 RepID=A0A067FDF4_CITSI|nr:hypothetical protein CISIN_1g023656mg [Citrus sinensis]